MTAPNIPNEAVETLALWEAAQGGDDLESVDRELFLFHARKRLEAVAMFITGGAS